jgi:hypothetical protein
MGFMLAEIALLQRFSVYLGHPIYSLSVCLFSLILVSGLGSLSWERLKLNARGKLLAWAGIVVIYHRDDGTDSPDNFSALRSKIVWRASEFRSQSKMGQQAAVHAGR